MRPPDLRIPEILRRTRNLEQRRTPRVAGPPRTFAGLDDVNVKYGHPTEAPLAGQVAMWFPDSASRFGGYWSPGTVSAGGGGEPTIGKWTDDGIFDELAAFDFGPAITVDPYTIAVVTVTAKCTGASDIVLATINDHDDLPVAVPAPPVWRLTAFDVTSDPSGDDVVGATGVGAGWAQCTVFAPNVTSEPESHTIFTAVGAATTAYEFDATVEVTVRVAYTLLDP